MIRQPHRQPTRIEDYRPSGNQFTLRGLFIFMTASCVMLAILALVMKEASHWLGALLVPLICVVIIGIMELGRLMFPPKPSFQYYLPPVPQNPLQTAYFGDGDSPFAPRRNYFSDDYGSSPPSPQPVPSATNAPAPPDVGVPPSGGS